jgi:hypothetical protein
MRPAAVVLLLALGLAACGQPSSATRFEGDEGAVAQVVEDLQADGERGNADDICNDLLAKAMQERIAAGDRSCAEEMKVTIEDADAFELEVQDVTVQGATATAKVKGTDEDDAGINRTFEFAKEGNRWRILSFGSSG